MSNGEPGPLVDAERCTGCGRCVAACGERRLTLETTGYRKHAALRDDTVCLRCGKCVESCPVQALDL